MIQKELTGDLKLKWDRIQQAMRKINADGCLLTVDVNLYYTTGRIYSGYFYLPAEGAPWFFVKRPNGLAGDHVEYIRKPEQMAELFAFYVLEMPEKLLLEAHELDNAFVDVLLEAQAALVRADRAVELAAPAAVGMIVAVVIHPADTEREHSLRLDHSLQQVDLLIFRMCIHDRGDRRQNFFYGLDEFRLVRVGLLDVIDDTGDISIHNCILLNSFTLCDAKSRYYSTTPRCGNQVADEK